MLQRTLKMGCTRSLVLVMTCLSSTTSLTAHAGEAIFAVTGTDSKIKNPTYLVVESRSDWESLYQKHLGLADKEFVRRRRDIKIDFVNFVVVVIVHGEDSNNRGIDVSQVAETDDKIMVRFRPMWYQTEARIDTTTSYAFVVVPRSRKPFQFDESIQPSSMDSPVWKTRANVRPK